MRIDMRGSAHPRHLPRKGPSPRKGWHKTNIPDEMPATIEAVYFGKNCFRPWGPLHPMSLESKIVSCATLFRFPPRTWHYSSGSTSFPQARSTREKKVVRLCHSMRNGCTTGELPTNVGTQFYVGLSVGKYLGQKELLSGLAYSQVYQSQYTDEVWNNSSG